MRLKKTKSKDLKSFKKIPNKLTQTTMEDAIQGKSLGPAIKNIKEFMRLI